MRSAPAPVSPIRGEAGARRGGSGEPSSSATLAALYAPVIAILTADRGEQVNRVSAMLLEITQARDAEDLAGAGDFTLAAGHPGSQALDQRYKPLIAILLADREKQYALVKRLQLQIRAARDVENMEARGIGARVPGRPAPLVSPGMAAMLGPQGGVSMTPFAAGSPGPGLALVRDGPERDRTEAGP